MTSRGRWLALIALAGAFLGILRGQPTLALMSLSVLVWLLMEWMTFLWRAGFEASRLRFERSVNGNSSPTGYLWAGRDVEIEVRVSAATGSIGSLLLVRDVLPENLRLTTPTDNDNRPAQSSPDRNPEDASNEILVSTSCRSLQFRYRAAACAAGNVRLPGFRLVVSDPNGFFRRDLFAECPQTFRVFPACATQVDLRPVVKRVNSLPQHGIHRLQRSGMGSELLELREYAVGDPPKSIAWKVSARRDKLMTRQYESEVPVRIQLFVDGSIGTRTGGFGHRLLDQMSWVAASVARGAVSVGDPVGAMLFDERGMTRVPPVSGEKGYYRILEALSDFSVNPEPVVDRLTPKMLEMAASVCNERFPELLDPRYNQIPFTIFPLLPFARRRFERRLQLAAVMASLYSLSAEQHVRLIYDDNLMALYLQTFLTQSGMAWIEPVVAVRGRGFNDGLHRMQMLTDALSHAVVRARDNEVFVVMADLLECSRGISHLMPALRMTLARHHRVAVVCPSPTFFRPRSQPVVPANASAEALLIAAEQIRVQEQARLLQRELRRIGAAVSFSGEFHAVRMVMSEIDLARSGRLAGAGGRRS
ncbi:MAG: DUF58 domain-containing protein [Planctomycetaceae bacterium]|nr:DUF58 domain-containing protein [Planctomycetaceae bacterium]